MDLYDMMYDAKGSAYLDEKNGGEAQDIYVERLSDGTYILRPQSEEGKYNLSFKGLMSEGEIITKREAEEKTERFVIYSAENGYYSISPALGRDSLTLGISEKTSRYDHNYISLCKFTGAKNQMWAFEPIEPDGISLSFVSTTVKLYAVGTLYATLTPYNFGTDDIKWTSDNEDVVMIDSNGNYTALAPGKA
ncbi:MAG: Ig-like domain-containing protein, partial [Clostridia bacterium]|nr:Ig-like domain-containing protein [Clostridia bacterium]